jgi:hypothetical protein
LLEICRLIGYYHPDLSADTATNEMDTMMFLHTRFGRLVATKHRAVACAPEGSQKAQKQEAGADIKADGAAEEPAWFQPRPTHEAIYVTGGFDRTTVEEVAEVFSRLASSGG